MNNKQSVVVLISGSGSNLQAIIDRSLLDDSQYEVKAVISNKEGAYGLTRAENHNIPQHVIKHNEFDSREDFDQAMIDIIDDYKPKLVVLAGFMRILSAGFVQHYANKLLNIHPSLLPKYQGLHTHQRAIDAGDKIHGVSVHFVTEELDGGPVIIQSQIEIEKHDTAESLQDKIHLREHIIYPLCVNWFCSDKVHSKNETVYIDGEAISQALIYEDLSKGLSKNGPAE